MRRRTPIALALVALVVTALAATALAASASGGHATVKTRSTSLGTILVNARGRTLYLFEKDRGGKSACSGACAANWPPLITKGKPQAAGSARGAKLGTTRRSDGRTQVTYAGHPLYTFVLDTKAGSTKGEAIEAFGAEWYAVGTTGKKVERSGSGY